MIDLKGIHFIPDSAEGEKCGMCPAPAQHKVEEDIPYFDKPGQICRHPFTTYLCCKCFSKVMGVVAQAVCESVEEK